MKYLLYLIPLLFVACDGKIPDRCIQRVVFNECMAAQDKYKSVIACRDYSSNISKRLPTQVPLECQ